jgi:hypothetical protein
MMNDEGCNEPELEIKVINSWSSSVFYHTRGEVLEKCTQQPMNEIKLYYLQLAGNNT